MTDSFERALQERLLARSQVSPRDVEALRLFARTLPARRSFWRGPAFAWGLSAAAVVLAAAVVVPPLLDRVPGFGGDPSPVPTVPATPEPTAPEPTTGPRPSAPVNTPVPSVGFGSIPLLTGSGSNVTVEIDDPRGLVTGAEAEQAEATMSFRWFDSSVEAAGENAIRVTWVGYPRDEDVVLEVSRDGGKLVLHFIQDAPPPQSDGLGEDRILVLELSSPIDPSDVEVTFTDPS